MRRARRIAATLAGGVVGALAWAGIAGAQTTVDAWWLTGYGSMHVIVTGNHIVLERFDAYGNSTGHTITWTPGFCQLAGINGGNAAGAPGEILFVAPLGSECFPGYTPSELYAWRWGGWYEGYYTTAGYVSRITWGTGTKLQVW